MLTQFFSRESRLHRHERRQEKRLVHDYQKAESDNGYLMSLGGGICPFPTFEQWSEKALKLRRLERLVIL